MFTDEAISCLNLKIITVGEVSGAINETQKLQFSRIPEDPEQADVLF